MKESDKKQDSPLGTTRLVFLIGASLLGFLVICLGIGLFFDEVTADKMHIIAGFLPLAFGALGAMKVGGAWVKTKDEGKRKKKRKGKEEEKKKEKEKDENN